MRRLAVMAGMLAVAFAAAGRAAADELEKGEMAPDFELQGSDGETYKLRDFRGKRAVVIAWFPKAFTGG